MKKYIHFLNLFKLIQPIQVQTIPVYNSHLPEDKITISIMKNNSFLLRIAISCAILLFVSTYDLQAQNPVDSWTIVSTPASDQDTYMVGGDTYEYGQGNNVEITSVTYNGDVFTIPFASQSYVFRRVDITPNTDGVNVVGNKASVFFERTGGSNFIFEASLPGTPGNIDLEEILKSTVINRGSLDVFKNTGTNSGDEGPSNIERIDVIFPALTINSAADLPLNGFLASEKNGNNTFKAAAILSIDGMGNPTSYGNLVTIVANTSYGEPTVNSFNPSRANSFIEDSNSDNQPIRVGGGSERMGLTLITFSDLGITAGQTFYGISFFGDDVVDSDDLLDPTTFPQNTGTGADIYGALGAIVTASGFVPPLDSDGDLVADSIDLDDDNDGIPDAVEGDFTCTAVTDLNTPNFATNTNLVTGGATGTATLNGLDNGTFNFNASVGGSATWNGGIQIQNQASVGDFIYAQPRNASNASPANVATYEFDFPNPVSDFEFFIGGLNNGDQATITAFIGPDPINITPANFSDFSTAQLVASGNTVIGNEFDNSADPLINTFKVTVFGDVDRIVVTSGKSTNDNNNVTIGMYSFGYCSALAGIDFDNDGIPNSLDLDSDDDGILDVYEAGGTDLDNNGIIDGFVDNDNDGLNDAQDNIDSGSGAGEVTSGTPLPLHNTDATGQPDYLDIDADDDGIVDNIEGQSTTGFNPPLEADDDMDGIDNQYDTDFPGNNAFFPIENTDGDTLEDYRDRDSDNDGDDDILEGWDNDSNGIPSTVPLNMDSDGDGLDDAFDNDTTAPDPDNDQVPTDFPDAQEPGGDRDWRDFADIDNDGVADNIDLDNDNDGIPDVVEGTLKAQAILIVMVFLII